MMVDHEGLPVAEDDGEKAARAWAAATWLDDFWSVVIAIPALSAFVPGVQDVVSRGFQILATDAPAWYLGALAMAVSWGFARRVGWEPKAVRKDG